MAPNIRVRPAGANDVKFITNSWLESYRDAPFPRNCPNSIYYHYQHKLLEQLIPRSYTLVAVNPSETDQILGWICAEHVAETLIVHYVYIKGVFRKQGVASALLNTVVSAIGGEPKSYEYTHKTSYARRVPKVRDSWAYNPYLMFMSLPEVWYGGEKALQKRSVQV